MMNEALDTGLVDWSRAQFALTAMYHWIFVPLILGLSFIIAFMETIYVKTGDPEWKKITKFWMTLFGINFAIGVATGIILEFEFGTNWSNYSWFVGDIFGAPLAIEGIMAFFLESTFIAVMFFGWNKVSKRFHLVSTWLVAFGANISALWILVANAWMQNPVAMRFNPDMVRNEMANFWDVLFSPVAINKFLHTISSGFVHASIFVIAISAWYLLKKREVLLAKRSMIVASVFGLITALYLAFTGDISAKLVSKYQPMKLAAFEGHYDGTQNAPLKAFGIVSSEKDSSGLELPDIKYSIEFPNMLSFLAFNDATAYVPGIRDLIDGVPERGIMSAKEKIERGKVARQTLRELKDAQVNRDSIRYDSLSNVFTTVEFQKNYFSYFGYSFITDEKQLIPNIPLTFYSFHIMVICGFYFILLFVLIIWANFYSSIENKRYLLWLALFSLPLPYLAGQAGWVVAEVGRQPWAIQDYLPVMAAVSHIDTSAVKTTFILFGVVFTGLLIAEIKIMLKQIKIGPKDH